MEWIGWLILMALAAVAAALYLQLHKSRQQLASQQESHAVELARLREQLDAGQGRECVQEQQLRSMERNLTDTSMLLENSRREADSLRQELDTCDRMAATVSWSAFVQAGSRRLEGTLILFRTELAEPALADLPRDSQERYFQACAQVLSCVGVCTRYSPDSLCCMAPTLQKPQLEQLWQALRDCRSHLHFLGSQPGLLLAVPYAGEELARQLLCMQALSRDSLEVSGLQLLETVDTQGLLKKRDAFLRLLDKKQLRFYLQPMVSSATAKIIGYELLPEPRDPVLANMEQVLRQARLWNEQGRLAQVIHRAAMETLAAMVENGKLLYNTRVWLKSPMGCEMSWQQERAFQESYLDYLKNVILELPEPGVSPMSGRKRQQLRQWGAQCAIRWEGDEGKLLHLQPEWLKLSGQGLDQDKAAQTRLKEVAREVHGAGRSLVVSDISTLGELETAMALGADLLQGPYLAKPDQEPPQVLERAIEKIGQVRYGKRR